jgi:hypothetical protein
LSFLFSQSVQAQVVSAEAMYMLGQWFQVQFLSGLKFGSAGLAHSEHA